VDGVRFAAAVCTNLSGDHLDYHGTMEAYAACKRALFERLDADAICVINADDAAVHDMAVGCAARLIRCSLEGAGDVLGYVSSVDCSGVDMQVKACTGTVNVRVPLLGRHNAMNALQALAVAEALGEDISQVAQRLGQAVGPAGRLEVIHQSPSVLVDFAHTDGALEAVLRSLGEVKVGRIIVVVGCGGDRDRTKRPRMARVASSFADLVWLTSDNPRTEDPQAILDDMVGGVAREHLSRLHVQPDRSLAITEAIAEAKPNDIVLIAGKGHERHQLMNGHSIPFDDRVIAMQAIETASASS
jgi:UDP-N-acetylmuramoyl-L-alanyl-D-glutamate--2,6-diaminopimelate ligase